MRFPHAIALLALVPLALRAQDTTARDTTIRDTTPRGATAHDTVVRDTVVRANTPRATTTVTSSSRQTPPRGAKTVIVRYGFDDGAVEIDVRPGAFISIAGAQDDSAATVTVRGSDARLWTDSTTRMFRRAAPRKRTVVVLQRSTMAEAADSGAAVSFIRRAETDTTAFQLYFANRSNGGFPLVLERHEADLFLAAMRRAVAVALPAATKPKSKPKPKPVAQPHDSTR